MCRVQSSVFFKIIFYTFTKEGEGSIYILGFCEYTQMYYKMTC
jgi:hypothetical protein